MASITGGQDKMALVHKFGEMWARNTKNIKDVPGKSKGGQGVSILYDGSTPVYVGKGNIRTRLPERSRRPVPSAFRSSIARPTDTPVYASSDM